MSDRTPPQRPSSQTSPAPDPAGDVIPGDPPVPITVWNLPKPRRGATVPGRLIARLIANYTHLGAPVLDLSTGPPLNHRPLNQHGPHRVELVITSWPLPQVAAESYLSDCAARLDERGCLAVVLTSGDIPDQLGLLVAAAQSAGLRYLQHVVVAHRPTPRTITTHRGASGSRSSERHIRVHTDVLLFIRPGSSRD